MKFGKVLDADRRNKVLGITTHQERRTRGDMINIYKHIDNNRYFKTRNDSATRIGHSKKILKQHKRTEIKRHSFTNRNIDNWNKLDNFCSNF